MTAQTATLTDFLLARIAEDEAAARAATPGHWAAGRREVMHGTCSPGQQVLGPNGVVSPTQADVTHIARHDPARVLAECEAKRRIVRDWLLRDEQGQMDGGEVFGYHATGVKQAVRRLAEVYSDHPDYNPNW